MADGTGDGDAQQPRGWFGFGGVRARAAAARRGPGVMRAAAFAARQGKGRGQPGGQTAHRQPLRRKCGAGHAGPPTRTGHDMHAGAAWATQYPVGRSRVWAARPQTMPHHRRGQACVRLQRRGAVGAALGARADSNPSPWAYGAAWVAWRRPRPAQVARAALDACDVLVKCRLLAARCGAQAAAALQMAGRGAHATPLVPPGRSLTRTGGSCRAWHTASCAIARRAGSRPLCLSCQF